jgi:hypothetical protein
LPGDNNNKWAAWRCWRSIDPPLPGVVIPSAAELAAAAAAAKK